MLYEHEYSGFWVRYRHTENSFIQANICGLLKKNKKQKSSGVGYYR